MDLGDTTIATMRGCIARICVQIDLKTPLILMVHINDKQFVEYKGRGGRFRPLDVGDHIRLQKQQQRTFFQTAHPTERWWKCARTKKDG
ncbi:hypothetical protein M9H77_25742 [Catharanthus roseus]|uniref:Uncharacterized protein n=1 Tax=Catharanthus roseus TaxID=4058 RepID=A0ACC0A812_CATRO|nr:hypothetical protein M9H77_25742 [Catharanthus roseus]